jgi:hypothetical protein
MFAFAMFHLKEPSRRAFDERRRKKLESMTLLDDHYLISGK